MGAALLTALSALCLSAASVAGPTVVVDTAHDRALPCAANAALIDALKVAAPDVDLAVGTRIPLRSDVLRASLGFEENAWQLDVRLADGTPAFSRMIPGSPIDCPAVASASAVIVERYVTELNGPRQEVRITPLSTEPTPRRVTIAAGPALRIPVGVSPNLEVELDAATRIGRAGFAQLGVSGTVFADSVRVVIQDQEQGALEARTFALWGAGGACLGAARALSVCGGPFAGAFAFAGSATGEVFQKHARVFVTPELGMLGSASKPIGDDFVVAAGLRVGVPLIRSGILVEGTGARLSMPSVDAQLGIRLGWALSL